MPAMANPRDPDEFSMSFGEHLEELRRRLINSILGVAVAMCLTMYFGRSIVIWLYEPLAEVQRQAALPTQTYTRSAMSGFMVYLKVSLVAGAILAAPWILYQLWQFIRAGLYPAERRIFLFLAPLSGAMTALGVTFMYYLFLPAALSFLIFFTTSYPAPPPAQQSTLHHVIEWFNWANDKTFFWLPGHARAGNPPTTEPAATQPGASLLRVPVVSEDPADPIEGQVWFNKAAGEMRLYEGGRMRLVALSAPSMMIPLIDPGDYIDEVLLLSLVIVLVFHVPVVMAMVGAAGLFEPDSLARHRKVVVFSCFVLAVFITPNQDIFSNIALPMLMWGLFELGLVLMRFTSKRHKREETGA